FRVISLILICIGAGSFVAGLFLDRVAAWSAYLVTNYYFFSLSRGGIFFYVIQSITRSGWSSAFRRVPEAMMAYMPFAAVFFLLLYFGTADIYRWSVPETVAGDALLQKRSVFMNVPFFYARVAFCFVLWIIFIRILRKLSLREDSLDPADHNGIMALFGKSELYSKIFIFILVITFSLSAFDLIMSIDVHWYSTIFAFKNLIAAFLHGVSVMILIIFILHRRGYFSFLNKYHLHDFARYLFMLSILWGYFWFAQFMLIWYGNIPEETVYYYLRWQEGWKVMFFLEIGLNWAVPFMLLLPVKTSRNMTVITIVIAFLIIGQYIDLFVQVIPGTTGILKFGLVEAGLFLGYAGLFALVVATALSKARITGPNHPFLEESLKHKF
ncbi:MAG: hypothetical protein GX158_10750, partial [Bacteroidales bacterium]|nr:hypothetical protein [Bacteroidales bacterium]